MYCTVNTSFVLYNSPMCLFLPLQIRIQNDSQGHSYETLFGHVFTSDVTSVTVEDPYIRAHHQILNLVRLCEMMVKRCGPSLNRITAGFISERVY